MDSIIDIFNIFLFSYLYIDTESDATLIEKQRYTTLEGHIHTTYTQILPTEETELYSKYGIKGVTNTVGSMYGF